MFNSRNVSFKTTLLKLHDTWNHPDDKINHNKLLNYKLNFCSQRKSFITLDFKPRSDWIIIKEFNVENMLNCWSSFRNSSVLKETSDGQFGIFYSTCFLASGRLTGLFLSAGISQVSSNFPNTQQLTIKGVILYFLRWR